MMFVTMLQRDANQKLRAFIGRAMAFNRTIQALGHEIIHDMQP